MLNSLLILVGESKYLLSAEGVTASEPLRQTDR